LRAGVPGARNAGTVGAAQWKPARAGVKPRRPWRRSSAAQRSGAGRAACSWPAGSPPRRSGASPRFRGARGRAAPPSATQEREPRPKSERSVSESGDERRADPPRSFWRRLRRGGSRWAQRGPRRSDQGGHDSQAGSAADGLRDVPARVLQERRVRARCFAHTPPPAGLHSTGRSASGGGSRMRDSYCWRAACRLDH